MAFTDPTGYISIPPDLMRGVAWKQPCRVATTANITISTGLNAGDSIDGVTLAAGDRVLVKDQSTGSENGIYVVGATPVRAFDMDQDLTTSVPAEESLGAMVYVIDGTANGATFWRCTNTTSPVIGTDSLTFAQWTGSSSGGSPFYDVTAYGALGDGTTDDTTAITDTFDAADATGGGVIYFPPTSDYYKITTLITRTGTSSYHLLGGGARHAPARVHQATSNTGAFKFAPSSGTANRDKAPLIENLTISGAGAASSGRGIEGANDFHIRDCFVAGFYDGIYLAGASYYSSIKDTTVTDCDFAGIRLVDTNNTTIEGCRVTGQWGAGTGLFGPIKYGIHINAGYPFGISNRIVDTSVEYYTDYGIYWNGGFACLLQATYQESQQSSSGFAHLFVGDTEYMNGMVIVAPYGQGDGTSGFYGMKFDHINGLTITGGFMGVNAAIGITSTANSSNFLIMNLSKTGSPTWTLPASSYILDPASPPMNNPMTTAGDLIRGGTSGVPTRLGIGSNGEFLKVVAGALAWGSGASALDDLTDVTITSAAVADRLRYNGTVWVNSALGWRPMTTYDPASGLWVPLVDGDGNAIMAEA